MSGQSVLDRVTAAKHTITGSDLAKSVCKATTEEVMGPKKKHLDYLIQCTNTEHINIPELADTLTERTAHTSWVVVFKALVTSHHLMVYGHERFMRYMATRTVVFNLENFLDKTGVQGYDMSTYIRRYSKYLNQKALAYRSVAFDFCRVKRGKDEGVLRTMNVDKLLKTLPALQDSMDALLAFDVTPNELTNGVINSGFMLLFKDSIRLFACYNDGIINLLEKYFEMNKKECKIALDIYKKFLIRMEKVGEFLKTAEQVGIDKGEIPDLAKFMDIPPDYKHAPSSLLEALEQHLNALEGKKGGPATTPTSSRPALVTSTVNAFSSVMAGVDEVEKKRAIEEEKARLAALKEERLREAQVGQQQPVTATTATTQSAAVPAPSQPSNNPFMTSGDSVAPATTTNTDLFGVGPSQAPTTTNNVSSTAYDDLMSLTPQVPMAVKQAQMAHPAMGAPAPWGSANGGAGMPATNPGQALPPEAMFPQQQQQQQQQPPPMSPPMVGPGAGFTNNNDIGANFDNAFGTAAVPQGGGEVVNILQPMNTVQQQQQQQQPKTEANGGTSLDTTLSKLATSLDIGGHPSPKRTDHQWTKSTTGQARTGGANWSPQMYTTTAVGQQSQWGQGQGAPVYMEPQSGSVSPGAQRRGGQPADWRGNAYSGQFSAQQGMGQQPMMGGPRPVGQQVGFGGQPMYQGQPRPQQPGQTTQDPFW